MEKVTLTPREQTGLQVLNRLLAEHMTLGQGATLMGLSPRHTRRVLAACREKGAAAPAPGRRGRRAPNPGGRGGGGHRGPLTGPASLNGLHQGGAPGDDRAACWDRHPMTAGPYGRGTGESRMTAPVPEGAGDWAHSCRTTRGHRTVRTNPNDAVCPSPGERRGVA